MSTRLAILGATLCWAAILLFAAYVFAPSLNPVHVEGFSASIVALGIHVSQNTVADFMPFAPFNADYFGLTKLGVVLGVSTLSPILGGTGAMRAMMLVGIILLVASSVFLIRRWSGARWIVVATATLIMPMVTESAFFFNDNVPAAALISLALALLTYSRSWPVTASAGVLIGCAIAARTDMMLVAAAVPLVLSEGQSMRRTAIGTATCAVVSIGTLFGLFALVHASPLDAIRSGQWAIRLWDRPPSISTHLCKFVYACGLPGLAFLFLGGAALYRARQWPRLALLFGIPMLFNLLLFGKMWEVRQFLVLTPFFGALIACGIEKIIRDFARGERILPVALALFCTFVIAGPVGGLILTDGPRTLTGRLRGMILWRDWQNSVRGDFARIDQLISSATPGRPLVVLTDFWNEDRYLHLQMLQQGFSKVPAPNACNMLGEAMQHDGRAIIVLTVHQTFVPYGQSLMPIRMEQGVRPCISALHPRRIVLLAEQDRARLLLGRSQDDGQPVPSLRDVGMSEILAISLSADDVLRLEFGYRSTAGVSSGNPADLLTRAQLAVRSRSAFSR